MKKRSILAVSLGLLVSTLAVSCGNQEANTPNTIVTKVEISNGASIDLKVDETKKLDVNLVKTGKDEVMLKFESLDSSVATVDNDGNIKGLKVGTTAIIVKTNFNPEIFDVISVNVLTNEVNVPVTGIELNDIDVLAVGDTASLKVTVLPESATNKEVSFMSLNEEIATVDNEGNIKALKAGETYGDCKVIKMSILLIRNDLTSYLTFFIKKLQKFGVDNAKIEFLSMQKSLKFKYKVV